MAAGWLAGEDIVCLALRAWDSPWKNNQQVASLLARFNRVLYVAPQRSLRESIAARRAGANGWPSVEERAPGLFVYREPWYLSRIRDTRRGATVINGLTERARAAHVRRMSRRLGFRAPILWVYDAMAAESVGTFGEKLVVFHVIDRYDQYYAQGTPRLKSLIVRRERMMLETADVVFAVSEPLHQLCRAVNSNSYLIPNGVNYRLFADAMRTERVPQDMAGISRPVIGYVGGVHPRLDFQLLRQMATMRPAWSFVLVGPTESLGDGEDLRILSSRPNVHYLGPKPVEQVPFYVKSCDVCLIPYRYDGFAPYTDLLKIYEYLACGRPVVSSDLPSSRRFVPLVRIAGDVPGYLEAIEASLAERGEQQAERMAVAAEHSWERRVDLMRELVSAELAQADRRRAGARSR